MFSNDEGLRYQGLLPAAIRVISALPDNTQLAIVNTNNESILKASLLLHEALDIDEHDNISLELRRQDFKIDLLLNMVGELLAKQLNMPKEQQLSFTANSLVCDYTNQDEEIFPGNQVEVSIYIAPSTPKPLVLFGSVEAIKEEAKSFEKIFVNFFGINQVTQDYLEKFIFRQHRRNIAQSKLIH